MHGYTHSLLFNQRPLLPPLLEPPNCLFIQANYNLILLHPFLALQIYKTTTLPNPTPNRPRPRLRSILLIPLFPLLIPLSPYLNCLHIFDHNRFNLITEFNLFYLILQILDNIHIILALPHQIIISISYPQFLTLQPAIRLEITIYIRLFHLLPFRHIRHQFTSPFLGLLECCILY